MFINENTKPKFHHLQIKLKIIYNVKKIVIFQYIGDETFQ